MEITTLAEGDQAFNNRAQLTGFSQCGDNLFMLNKGLGHVAEQHLTML
jgi:hypothetical protein